jgi:DNA-binding transcriptional LysR family regulator
MNLNQLRFAQAVAEAGTFTAGAERCYVTQSTLSTGLAQLERELGQRLFARTTRSVALTPFGEHLLPLIGDVLDAHARMVAAAANYLEPGVRQVRIGMCPLVDLARVETILGPYRAANPDVDVILEQLAGVNPRLALTEGRFDFLLGPSELRHHQIERFRMYQDELVYLRAAGPGGGASGVRGASVRLEDIAADTFLLVNPLCGLTIRTRQLFRSRHLPLNAYRGEAVSYQVLEEWAGLGVGSAVLPRSKVSSPDVGQPIVLGNGQRAMIRFEASWLPSRTRAVHVQALANHMRRAGPALSAAPAD